MSVDMSLIKVCVSNAGGDQNGVRISWIAPCARAAIAALWPEPLHAPESREIVQISPFKDTISALCADGTIWVFNSSRYPEGEWVSLPRIPDL